jgi:hypothetical protein
VGWINLAGNRVKWQAIMNTFLKMWGICLVGEELLPSLGLHLMEFKGTFCIHFQDRRITCNVFTLSCYKTLTNVFGHLYPKILHTSDTACNSFLLLLLPSVYCLEY